jgi:hypothetical protein
MAVAKHFEFQISILLNVYVIRIRNLDFPIMYNLLS